MNENIQDIATKFLKNEKIRENDALVLGSLGLTRSAGDIAGLTYGVNFSQHPFNSERRAQLAEYLGYALLNWHILAQSAGFATDEIERRFVAAWESKQRQNLENGINSGHASIKDLLKHLKASVKQESATQEPQINREPPEINFTR